MKLHLMLYLRALISSSVIALAFLTDATAQTGNFSNVVATGNISAGNSISAQTAITTNGHVFASDYLQSGGNIWSGVNGHLLLGGGLPSGWTATSGYNSVWLANANSGLVGETEPSVRGIYLLSNVVRSSAGGWALQDQTQAGWQIAANYTSSVDRFSVIHYTSTSGSTSSQNLFTVTGAGNVGIGNAWPASKLDVNGDVHVSGNIIIAQPQGDISMGAFNQ